MCLCMPERPSYAIIFKTGDDLRQDMLALQAFAHMDTLWKQAGLHLGLTLYAVVATAPAAGMIAVVPRARTMAKIQKASGGAAKAFSKRPLREWLERVSGNVYEAEVRVPGRRARLSV